MISPTKRQLDLLRFITGHIEAIGTGPTVREMMTAMQSQSSGCVHEMLVGLQERGMLRRLPRRARAIDVISPPPIPRGPAGEPLYFVPAPAAKGGL